jgi:hypothetical protein
MAKDAGATGSIYAPPTTDPEIRFNPDESLNALPLTVAARL